MMSFLQSLHKSSRSFISFSRVLFYSTETNVVQQPKQNSKNDNLYNRISPVGDPKASIIPILQQWESEGKSIKIPQIIVIIKSLRKFNRYTHALQLSEWMSNKKGKLQPAGIAVHLDLVSRVHGLEQAENYFHSMSDDVKNFQVYGSLLNCYCTTKSIEKAEATAEKMRQLGMMTTLSYNSMLNLYKKTGDVEKGDKIYQEMLEMAVPCDKQTCYIRLSAYVAASDLEKMERVLKDMEESSAMHVDSNAYIIAAGGYMKSGLPEKAYEMLKKSEEHVRGNSKGAIWEILLRMYASLGKKEDVYRIWDLYKTTWRKVYNRGYSSMIGALVKLDEIEGAEKILAEWESEKLSFDFRIPNMLLKAYCMKGLLAKAEAYVDRVVGMGKEPPASSWTFFVAAYARDGEMEKAVETLKKCVGAVDNRGAKLDEDTYKACVEYLKGKSDLESIHVPETFLTESLDDKLQEMDEVEEIHH